MSSATSHTTNAVLVWLNGIRRLLRGMLGANAYNDYVAHRQRVHPGKPVMSEREFWREQAREQEANPGARCC
ncbi:MULTISPECIES: YbdD/YjiX family protein [unclassified Pseudoclavibacter]|uniref:YbdD/YjiX family protein n=1 Tax=unclassified Pseudoclavibacter TaxID=2615177 RepID=UPI00130101E9|nr:MULTISPECIES: YbdD/YjiX family protein [unclassified Pseudoclavibacter]KAB1644346.1 YbdD/YjiX family protein [Pseudoclavibacter sp. CFCC 14310]KAB1664152.1 YbdD/YjiX family protein [Pseudoclavibacter sp. CFCC 13611]